MKRLLIAVLFAVNGIGIFAQELETPYGWAFDPETDNFAVFEKEALQCVGWLIHTPMNALPAQRQEINDFLVPWITKHPDIQVELDSDIIGFIGHVPGSQLVFMGGWVRYAVKSRNYSDKIGGNIAGIEAVIDYYTLNRDYLTREPIIEKYITLQEKGKLRAFVEGAID